MTYFRGVARRAEPVIAGGEELTTAGRFAGADERRDWVVGSSPYEVAVGRLDFAAGGPARFVVDQGRCLEDVETHFELALANSVELALAASEDDFARALYAAITNMTWIGPGEAKFKITFREAGGLVARLRGQSEEYMDFYGSALEGVVRADVAGALARLGWRARTAADHAADVARLAALVKEWAARPIRYVEPWFETYVDAGRHTRGIADPSTLPPTPPASSGHEMLWWVAQTARVSPEEYSLAWVLDDDCYVIE